MSDPYGFQDPYGQLGQTPDIRSPIAKWLTDALGTPAMQPYPPFPKPPGPVTPPPTGPQIPQTPAGVPQIGPAQPPVTQRRVPGEEHELQFPARTGIPEPLNLPTGGPPSSFDPEQARQMLAGAAPTPPTEGSPWADVLGGLARGAGSVDATKPGSFAAALAAAGAGGMAGRAAFQEREQGRQDLYERQRQQFQLERARQEMQIAEIAQSHSDRAWQLGIEAQKLNQEDAYRRQGLTAPVVNVANGVASSYDPISGKAKYMDIRGEVEKYGKLGDFVGTPGTPQADYLNMDQISKSNMSPEMKVAAAKTYVMTAAVTSGYGPALFGKNYEAATKFADKQLEKFATEAATHAIDYIKERNKFIIAFLMEHETANDGWIHDYAGMGNIAAKSMYGSPVLNVGNE